MADLPAINRSEYDTHELTPKQPIANSSRHRSSSVKPSMRSSRSRITLVGYDAELDVKVDVAYGTTNKARAFTWSDHLLGVFCIRKRGRVMSTTPARPTEPDEDEGHHRSPWVLPVYVLSSQKDESRHFIPKEAKCTIDTGNLQGNIVSKTFVTDILEYPESSFQPLTKLEEAGGTGVTGHKLIPQGAIYLTWYHSNSTRIFRDMRFLISEHPMYDLIIGSRSIHQNRILDVPNLMDDGINLLTKDPKAKMLDDLIGELNEAKKELAPFRFNVEVLGSTDANVLEQFEDLKTKVRIADQNVTAERERLALCKIYSSEEKNNRKDVDLRQAFEKEFNKIAPDLPPADQNVTAEREQLALCKIYSSEEKNNRKDVDLRQAFEKEFNKIAPDLPPADLDRKTK